MWATLDQSDIVAQDELHATNWIGPFISSPALSGTVQAGISPDPSRTVTGTGTDFMNELSTGCFVAIEDYSAKVLAIVSGTEITIDKFLLINSGTSIYMIDEMDADKRERKRAALSSACSFLENLPDYNFDPATDAEKALINSLLAFEIFNGDFYVSASPERGEENPSIKRERIGDSETEYFDRGGRPGVNVLLPRRLAQLVEKFAITQFGGVICPPPDYGI